MATKVTVLTASSTELLAISTSGRKKIILQNMGDNIVWCAFGADAAVDDGFFLRPSPSGDLILDRTTHEINQVLNAIAVDADTEVNAYEL